MFSDRQGKLGRHRRRLERRGPPVRDLVARAQFRDLPTDGLGVSRGEVGPPPVESLVALELGGPVTRQVVEEVLARAWTEVQEVGPQVRGARVPGRADDLRE